MCDSCPVIASTTAPSSSKLLTRPHELVPARVSPERRRRAADVEARAGIGQALESSDGRADEEKRPDERRNGVPGEAEHECSAPHAERERFARLHGDAPEHLLDPEISRHGADEVVRADRDAARRHEHVGFQTALDRRTVRLLLVLHDREQLDLRARGFEHRGDHHPVRLVDLAGGESLARGA